MSESIIKKCVDCNNEFVISFGEQKFFKELGYDLPKRCSKCRKAKRERSKQQNPVG